MEPADTTAKKNTNIWENPYHWDYESNQALSKGIQEDMQMFSDWFKKETANIHLPSIELFGFTDKATSTKKR